jgi:hypothetical protein
MAGRRRGRAEMIEFTEEALQIMCSALRGDELVAHGALYGITAVDRTSGVQMVNSERFVSL